MKKSNIIMSTMLIAFSSASLSGIDVIDSKNGAWLKVTDQGKPAVNAVVSVANVPQIQGNFETDSNGRVYVPLSLNRSTSVKYSAVTEDGQSFSRYAFHGGNNDKDNI